VLTSAGISAAILWRTLKHSNSRFPKEWEQSQSRRRFQLSISFLFAYLAIVCTGEWIAVYLSCHGIYNSYVMSLNVALSTPFLFGFFYLHTRTAWKRYAYILFYLIPLGFLISGGYFHPKSVLSEYAIPVIYIPFFLVAFLHMTDLLITPQSEYFKFRIKIGIIVQVHSLLVIIITFFYWSYQWILLELIRFIHLGNISLYYLCLAILCLSETFKQRKA
jgi:hypothetical protein